MKNISRIEFLESLSMLESHFDTLLPELELTIRDPEIGLEGYVVVHNTNAAKNGPLGRCGKGGTRISPSLSLDEIKMLAQIMTLKNAAAGIYLGGAKSGVKADPKEPGFETKYRRFVSLVKPILRANGGIFGGFGFDIGGAPEHALWACDELQSYESFTGKPLDLGGTDYDREGIAGLGVAVAGKTLLAFKNVPVHGASFAVQGIGAMGAAVIKYFTEMGGVLSVVSDYNLGGTYTLNAGQSKQFVDALKTAGADGASHFIKALGINAAPLESIISATCQVFFPCAIQDVITEENQHLVKAKFLVEGANNPCSPAARSKLHSRGVTVIPDFIANSGGILAAYTEMTCKVSNEENKERRTKVLEAKALTESKISENVREVLTEAERLDLEPVAVARYRALTRILRTTF